MKFLNIENKSLNRFGFPHFCLAVKTRKVLKIIDIKFITSEILFLGNC